MFGSGMWFVYLLFCVFDCFCICVMLCFCVLRVLFVCVCMCVFCSVCRCSVCVCCVGCVVFGFEVMWFVRVFVLCVCLRLCEFVVCFLCML